MCECACLGGVLTVVLCVATALCLLARFVAQLSGCVQCTRAADTSAQSCTVMLMRVPRLWAAVLLYRSVKPWHLASHLLGHEVRGQPSTRHSRSTAQHSTA